MDKLKVAFIGAGRISDLHRLGYVDNSRAELYAVCDVDEALAQRRAREWGAKVAYTNHRRLLADTSVDAVEVLTPHHLHAPIAIAALEAGKHVSVQKPMCLNLREADAMIAAARRSGKLFRVMENFRYHPAIVKAKELLDSGAIGEPLSMRMKVIGGDREHGWPVPDSAQEWRHNPALCGGGPAVFDHGYHMFSIAMYFLGPAEKVSAWIETQEVRPGWIADSPAMIMWKSLGRPVYGNYEVVRADEMSLRSRYYAGDDWFEVTGSKGLLWVNGCTSTFLDVPPLTMYRDGRLTHFTDLESDWAFSFAEGVRDFVNAVMEGRECQLNGAEAREVLRFALAAQLSAKEAREVRLEEVR